MTNPTFRSNLIGTMIKACNTCGGAIDNFTLRAHCTWCGSMEKRSRFIDYESFFKTEKARWGFETLSNILGDNLWEVISIVHNEGARPRYRNTRGSLEGFFRWVTPGVGRTTLQTQGIYDYYRSRQFIPWDIMVDAVQRFYNPHAVRATRQRKKYQTKVTKKDPRVRRDLSTLYYFMVEYGKIMMNSTGEESEWPILDTLMEADIYLEDVTYIFDNKELQFSKIKKVIDFYKTKKFPDVTNKFTKEKKIIYDLPLELPYDG